MPTTSAHATPAGNGRSQKKQSNKEALKDLAASTISVAAILELIDRLGVKDIVVSKLRSRLDEADVDALIDEAVEYTRRNPEVLVIALGAITVAAGAMVFLETRHPHRRDLAAVEKMPSERRRSARM